MLPEILWSILLPWQLSQTLKIGLSTKRDWNSSTNPQHLIKWQKCTKNHQSATPVKSNVQSTWWSEKKIYAFRQAKVWSFTINSKAWAKTWIWTCMRTIILWAKLAITPIASSTQCYFIKLFWRSFEFENKFLFPNKSKLVIFKRP